MVRCEEAHGQLEPVVGKPVINCRIQIDRTDPVFLMQLLNRTIAELLPIQCVAINAGEKNRFGSGAVCFVGDRNFISSQMYGNSRE
jgi:hypothetical protein